MHDVPDHHDQAEPGPSAGPPSASTAPPERMWVDGAIPAATVILVRDGDSGIETLMLRRDGKLKFAAGMWVFPGGRIDPGDEVNLDPGTSSEQRLEAASRLTAVRETLEETGLVLDPTALRRWSHWTAPEEAAPRRFTTAFYIAGLDGRGEKVVIDDGEIRAFMWRRPADLIAGRDAGEVGLTPPTFITLNQLLGYDYVDEVLADVHDRAVEHFATRFQFLGETPVAMYHGDAGYLTGEVAAEGPRHRLLMDASWHYLRDT